MNSCFHYFFDTAFIYWSKDEADGRVVFQPMLVGMPPTAPCLVLPPKLVDNCLCMIRCLDSVWSMSSIHRCFHTRWSHCHHIDFVSVCFLHCAAQSKVVSLGRTIHGHETARVEGRLRRKVDDSRSALAAKQDWDNNLAHVCLCVDVHVDEVSQLLDAELVQHLAAVDAHIVDEY